MREAISIEKRYFTSDLEQPFVGFVDLLDGDHFDVGGDVVLAAEVEHLLGLGNPADGIEPDRLRRPMNQAERVRPGSGFAGAPTSRQGPVEAEAT